ncbi:glycerophosphodiester phosphodiesterase family protein [Algibacter lectus]|uniref:glycerophosphodiester phosphodiesterase family protein n=1 Tax=Algibacter lectus TaxID=221126 RepID=UPI0026EAEF94|nr:glycerophosphodiester phosphodiesterase family protein [Algibacter lectus]MDO7138139.1 glycerophosphodiester phosphodiesterase family protein [Algibacter lectus]
MKTPKLLILIIIQCICVLGFSQSPKELKTRADSILNQLQYPSKSKVLAVSHRGAWNYAPENSLLAVKRCIDLGIDIVEIDVRLTKDSQLVLMHDKTIDRTTNGTGKVSDYTLEELKTFRLKNACGVRGSRQQVPTLEEVMTLSKDKIMINLDKVEGETVKEAYAVLKKTGTVKQAIFKGRENVATMMKKYGDIMNAIIYMPIVIDNVDDPSQYVQDYNNILKPLAYEVTFDSVNSKKFELIKTLNNQNITVLTIPLWDDLTAGHTDELALIEGPDAAWGWLINNGANAIMTDSPDQLLSYLRAKGLHD